MNILTDEEKRRVLLGWNGLLLLDLFGEIEAAVLAKLAAQDVEPVAWMQSTHLAMLEQRATGSSAMMARCSDHKQHDDFRPIHTEAQLLAAQQRTAEACAKVCEKRRRTVSNGNGLSMWSHDHASVEAGYCADAISNGDWREYL